MLTTTKPKFQAEPIGYFYSEDARAYELPRQGGGRSNAGTIVLEPHCNFEAALADLEGFTRIWLLFWFHQAKSWQPKVQPPRGGKKRGLFATRAPHRPNSIGISNVRLVKVEGRTLYIEDHDLLHETPILDIKPYIAYADAYPDASSGWLDEVSKANFEVVVDERALIKANWIKERSGLDLVEEACHILEHNPLPLPSNRIKQLADGTYILAFKTWRIAYHLSSRLTITDIKSGYTLESLQTTKRYSDYELHQQFLAFF